MPKTHKFTKASRAELEVPNIFDERAFEMIATGGGEPTPDDRCPITTPKLETTAAALTNEQLDGMDMWDRDVMLDERHRAVGAMLVHMATTELREFRAMRERLE